jgi:GAF domain-containing protein
VKPAEQPADNQTCSLYPTLCAQMKALLEGESDWVVNLANAAALLYGALPQVSWAGFYRMKNGELLLGPFQGKPACVHIAVGRGVCGAAVAQNAVQIVPDVHRFPGHIACDAASASELVIPLRARGRIVGVLDLDSHVPGRFSEKDAQALVPVAELIAASCSWDGGAKAGRSGKSLERTPAI